MRIIELETMGVRGLADGSWRFQGDRNGPGQVTLVTGPPRVGLTTFLEAITYTPALLAIGGWVPGAEEGLRSGGSAATIRTTWSLDPDESAFAGIITQTVPAEVTFQRGALATAEADPGLMALLARYDHAPTTCKVVSIPARRFLGGPSLFSDFEFEQRQKHLSPAADKFAGLASALARQAMGSGAAQLAEVQRLFAELTGTTRIAEPEPKEGLSFRSVSGDVVTPARLSASEQNALVLAAVPVLLGLQSSIVLLDTPESGLAPGEAARWVDVLRAWSPQTQWIIATRDAALLKQVEPAARIELSSRSA